jgi:hypothetical protein
LRGGTSTPFETVTEPKAYKKGVIKAFSSSHPHTQQCRETGKGGRLAAGVLDMSSVSTWVAWTSFVILKRPSPLVPRE